MKIRILYALLTIAAFGCDTASTIDPPDASFFVKFYGGEGDQEGVDAVLNTDGTITLFGTTDSLKAGNVVKQLYLVNIEQNGRIVWETTIPTASSAIAKDIELTNDGRLVIVGDIENAPNEHDIFIATLTLTGSLINNTLTGFVSGNPNPGIPTDEIAFSISQTSDGFIVSGYTTKLDLKPTIGSSTDTRDALHLRYFDDLTDYPNTWRQAHGPGDQDVGVKVIEVSPNQFYFFGYSNENGGDFNPYILGLGQNGETNLSYNFFPGNLGTNEFISSVVISPPQSGEGFLLTGISIGSTADIYTAKLRKVLSFGSSTSDFQSEKNLSVDLGPISNTKTAAFPSSNSGFLIVSNEFRSSSQNFYLTKIGNDGNLVWQNPIIFGGELDDEIGSVLEMPDGSIGIIGTFAIGQDGEKKMTFIKVNKEGKFSK